MEYTDQSREKLFNSRKSLAGWLTRNIEKGQSKFEILKSQSALSLVKETVLKSFESLKTVHTQIISLPDEDVLDAELWFEPYSEKVLDIVDKIDCKIRSLDLMDSDAGSVRSRKSDTRRKHVGMAETTVEELPAEQPGSRTDDTKRWVYQQPIVPPLNRDEAIDAWIDQLIPGRETAPRGETGGEANFTRALERLSVDRDLPPVEFPIFDGSAFAWPKFVEQFHVQVHQRVGITDSRRMDILLSKTKGEARKLIYGLGYSGRNYAQALQELKRVLGHKVLVARAYINSVAAGPVVQSSTFALRDFYTSIRDCLTTLAQLNYTNELSSCELLQRVARRLPFEKRHRWNEHVKNVARLREPNLYDLNLWLQDRVDAECKPYAVSVPSVTKQTHQQGVVKSSIINNTVLKQQTGHYNRINRFSCALCPPQHNISRCKKFIEKNFNERLAVIRSFKLCFNCLYPGHVKSNCPSAVSCHTCKKRHHTSLHRDNEMTFDLPFGSPQQPKATPCFSSGGEDLLNDSAGEQQTLTKEMFNDARAMCRNTASSTPRRVSVHFQIVPVNIKGQNGRFISTFALLDSASEISLIYSGLASDLGLKGRGELLTMNTLTSCETKPSKIVSLSLHSLFSDDEILIREAYTWLGSFRCPIQTSSITGKFEHLHDLNVSDINQDEVRILIGANAPSAHLQLEVRQSSNPDEPVAIRTPLGWCIMGTMYNENVSGNVNLNCFTSTKDIDNIALNKQIEKFWVTETLGVTADGDKKSWSVEDRRALPILNESCRLNQGKYKL
ncbi:uncharacterized protein LOC141906235 [Tubulanus polymorphus]|uniref:uncharacterized protein LOC141906235 n=1 Tax=Tubulanus polymorphus TaxID=672921 RepID=UPI003DA45FDA